MKNAICSLTIIWFFSGLLLAQDKKGIIKESADRKNYGLPTFPYGAVYFRKSNPPIEDWEKDYKQASIDGMNTFRHWFMWGSVEVAPGKFDWGEYDKQLELAAKNGMKTIVAEVIHSAPEWAFRQYAHARYETADGLKVVSSIRNSSATGGFPGLCLDNDDVKEKAGIFLRELVNRYKDHPGMGGYDIWNECNLNSSAYNYCYCPATQQKFRGWLKNKYGDLKTLATAWHRYSYATWEDVVPPKGGEAYPDNIDWVQFRIDNAYQLMKWRRDIIRKIDTINPITAHGVSDKPLKYLVDAAHDAWRAASLVDIYGYTAGSAQEDRILNNSNRWIYTDLTRCASRGKPFWAAEMAAWCSWDSRGGIRENGRIPKPYDVLVANMIGMGGGATGIFSSRWRGLLDGPLHGAYAFYSMDGSPNANSEMASKIAKWANAPGQEKLWQSRPVKGDIGIIWNPESQIHATLMDDKDNFYSNACQGAYYAFLDNNIQADWVHIDDIKSYDLLYLPYPVMLSQKTATQLMDWVAEGGCLISEGCPGYFGDGGRAGEKQPNLGLDKLFGATQEYVEFTPDLLEKLQLNTDNIKGISGGVVLQTYKLTTGKVAGKYEDGRIAIVDNSFGKGKVKLIGTMSGIGYFNNKNDNSKAFFKSLLKWAGKEQQLTSTGNLVARIHDGNGGTYIWVVNNQMEAQQMTLTLSKKFGPFKDTEILWGKNKPDVNGNEIIVNVPAVDALIVRLKK